MATRRVESMSMLPQMLLPFVAGQLSNLDDRSRRELVLAVADLLMMATSTAPEAQVVIASKMEEDNDEGR